jgi:hypothetical protein
MTPRRYPIWEPLSPLELTISQSRCYDRRPSHRGHVVGLHKRYEEEPPAELRPAAQQHPRRARHQVHPETAAELQPPAEYAAPAPCPATANTRRYQPPLRHVN